MAHAIIRADDVEPHDVAEWGHVGMPGTFRPVGEYLGVSAFGINQLELPPDSAAPEHDHAEDGQEEVYIVIRGRGRVRVDGTEQEIRPGTYVFLPPEARRQMVSGADGLVWVGIGCRPGAYQPP